MHIKLPAETAQKLSWHRSIVWRAVLRSVVLVATVVVALTITAQFLGASALQDRLLMQLTQVATVSEEQLQEEISDLRRQVSLLGSIVESNVSLSPLDETGRTYLADAFEGLRNDEPGVIGATVYDPSGERLYGSTLELSARPDRATAVVTQVSTVGWNSFDIVTPLNAPSGEARGWLMVRYDASLLIDRVLTLVQSLGVSGTANWGLVRGEDLLLLQPSRGTVAARAFNVGPIAEWQQRGVPLALAALGQEGIGSFTDVDGNQVVAAYRYLPQLDWGLVLKVNQVETAGTINELARMLLIVGGVMLVLASALAVTSGRSLTLPIRELRDKVRELAPRHWQYEKSLKTGDELEVLDNVLADITSRLQKAYAHLEGEVVERTEQLRKEYAKDRVILESIRYGIFVVERDGRIAEANSAALELLQRDTVVGEESKNAIQLMEHDAPLSEDVHPIVQCVQTGKEFRGGPQHHWNLRRADQSLLPVKISASPLLQDGEILGAVVLLQDVTAERQIDYMKNEFITLASHQLRTPLASMKWYLEFLSSEEQEHLSAQQKDFISELLLASQRMSNVVDELMDVSRLQGGGITPVPTTVDCKQFLQTLIDDLKGIAAERKVQLNISLPKQEVVISSDPMLLTIVLQNIVLNAIKYSENGDTVAINVQASPEGGAIIAIQDEGIGIPLSDQDRIFQKLFRARNVKKTEVNGSGLGLYSSKKIAEHIGATISFESKENEGTTFTVSVPPQLPETSTQSDAS